jgi:hypothetical protein
MLSGALPLFVRVTVWGGELVPTSWLPKVRPVVERPTSGATPVPVKFTICVAAAKLPVNTTEAVRIPTALGVNVTLSVHWADGASEVPQLPPGV